MNKDRRSKKRTGNNWKNNSNNDNSHNGNGKRFEGKNHFPKKQIPSYAVSQDQIRAEEEAISAFKCSNRPVCEHCGMPVADMSTAIENRKTGKPIHFDCAVSIISKEEKLSDGDRIIYIGQGRFGILYFANPHDMKHFTIKKTIEWENKEKKPEWRDQMAELYSHVR